ncbi:hypothetical protein [Bdellovibrio sp. GT3]|uniref:hypothetical protein n=1 Tax=Bdellovibrio sp. GT3 TaxID=3136282 RepID=UPI0030F2CBA8
MISVKSKNITWFVLATVFIAFIYSLIGRPIHIDDAWLGEYSYWWAQLGYVKSEALRGYFGAENKLFVYHKLFAQQGGLLIRATEFNVYILKALPLAYLCLAFILGFLFFKKWMSTLSLCLLFILVLCFHQIVGLSFTFRPEIPVMFFGMLAAYFLIREEKTEKKFIFISAFFAAIAAANHLNGMVYIGAGVLYLWIQKKWLQGFIYGVIGFFGVCYYFIDVRSLEDLKTLHLQFTNWRDVAGEKVGLLQLPLRVLREQERFFHTPPEIAYSLLLLTSLFVYFNEKIGSFHKETYRLLLYAALVTFCLSILAHGKSTKYIVYAVPFFMAFIVLVCQYARRGKMAILVVGSLYVLTNLIYNFNAFKGAPLFSHEIEYAAKQIPAGANVAAHYPYIFLGIPLGQKVQATVIYEDMERAKVLPPTAEDFFEQAAKFNIDYALIQAEDRAQFHIAYEKVGQYEPIYRGEQDSVWLFRRIR